MGNKMLIDAAHPEETRVVVLRGNRIEEFDFEAANKRQLRGNIYLAKVTRVEPSLQAAFIEYGGNRHGFLAFSEIHPDYYQIPIADRQQLLEDEARSAAEEEDEVRGSSNGNGGGSHRRSRRHRRGGQSAEKRAWAPRGESVSSEEIATAEAAADLGPDEPVDPGEVAPLPLADPGDDAATLPPLAEAHELQAVEIEPPVSVASAEQDLGPEMPPVEPTFEAEDEAGGPSAEAFSEVVMETSEESDAPTYEPEARAPADPEQDADASEGEAHEEDHVEQLGGDALEDVPHRVSRPRRNYKIQEVIKRRQVLLVQVVKEERGNKGAALTTYLSLAGRYSVLMPNTARGGGISRKIVDPEDRKRLKAIVQELEVPDGMGIILRTAGAARGMPEVKRDFEYLMRMWETVRETTLKSSAPTLVYEEGSLIKRSIRDLFTKDVDEVVVAGDTAYREAKDFMRLLMPNHVKNVVAWRESQPIFAKSGAEAQLDAMFSNQVVLKSGGYLVINQTEALVAIDVNSGRSTREHNIEDTALRTNLEAADEIARQLRLRDLAGLIVVDFIDMEEGRNDRAVERRLKDALKNDRARIQIGRISHFGLLEMSRQRMRTGVLEGSTVLCPHCAGAGTVRSVSSMALHMLRLLEDALIRSAAYNLVARTRAEVALYILNQKRANLMDLESRFGVAIAVMADPAMIGMVYHAIDRGTEATPPQFLPFRRDDAEVVEEAEDLEDDVEEQGDETDTASTEEFRASSGEEGGRRRRRRRRRRGRDGQGGREPGEARLEGGVADLPDAVTSDDEDPTAAEADALADIEGGFMAPEDSPAVAEEVSGMPETVEAAAGVPGGELPIGEPPAEDAESAPRRRRSRRAPRGGESAEGEPAAEAASPVRRPRRTRRAAEAGEPAASPSADRDVGADTAQQHPPTEAEAGEPELPLGEPAGQDSVPSGAEPWTAAETVVSPTPEPEPDRPKRSGWWQRAKATFSAGS